MSIVDAILGKVLALAESDKRYSPLSFVPSIPAGLGWDTTHFGFTASITDLAGSPRSVASLSITPESLFDGFSTARSAPGATFYVNYVTGLDANNGLTSGTAFRSIWKAIVAANAAAVPTTVFVASAQAAGAGLANSYFRTNNPWYNGGTGVFPTVDLALIATGGRVNTGTFDAVGTPTRDATNVNCYSWAVSSVNRVCNIAELNRFGNYTELVKVGTAALCNVTPDSWALVSGTLYVNRRDQAAPTDLNTRVYRPGTACVGTNSAINLYIGGQTDTDGFDFEGGNNIGVLQVVTATPGTTNHVTVAKNSTFKYGGGYTDTLVKGVSIDGYKGLAAFFGCRSDANWSDGFNHHNDYSAAGTFLLTVNCSAFDNGRGGSTSNNGWTSHEDCVGIDLAGYYEGNRGGTVRSINNAKSYLAGTTVKDDLGDLFANGVVPPTAFQTDNSAEYWCERTKVIMAGGGRAYYANNAGTSKIHRRNVLPSLCVSGGAGTVDTY